MFVESSARLVFTFALYISISECARILAVFPVPSRSHFIFGNKLLVELARRGHQVTMVSPFAQEPAVKNYRNIVLENFTEVLIKPLSIKNRFDVREYFLDRIMRLSSLGGITIEEALNHENFQKLLNANETFDLVIAEIFQSEALLGLSHVYHCPVIGMHSFASPNWINHLVGNPAPFSYSPEPLSEFGIPRNWYERLLNSLSDLMHAVYKKFIHFPRQNKIMKKYFNDVPDLEKIMYTNVALIFLNTDPTISGALPLVPAIIPIGGYHIDEPKILPKDIQKFLDNAENGAILFSMGSILDSANLAKTKLEAILSCFSKLNQNILWKFDDRNLRVKLNNLKIAKWLPQNDILVHRNIKAFITHGGMLSITEAVFNGVPIIGIPVFGDQKMNVDIAVSKGYGLKLNLAELTAETLSESINEIINNSQYSENAKSRSKILRSHFPSPMEKAVFWTEHVLAHKGAAYLRSPALSLHWTELYLLDVIFITSTFIMAILSTIYILIKFICRNTFRHKPLKRD